MPGNGTITDKLPPQNLEAEKSLIGSILLDKESINRVADMIEPDDFYNRAHQMIFEAIIKLYQNREPIDLLSLSDVLAANGHLEIIGGIGYLTSLVNSVPTSAHIVHYAQIVERKKTLRDLIDSAHGIIGLGYQEDEDVEGLLDQAEQRLFSVSQRSVQQNFLGIDKSLHEAFDRLDRLHKGDGALRGVPTGFVDLDSKLAGLQKSNLVILAARPSMGKTSLALDIVREVGKIMPVGFFTIEMSREEVTDRLIAAEAGVSLWKMRTGRLSSEGEQNDFEKIAVALDSLAKTKIFIEDSPSPTVMQMRAMARRLQAEHGLGLIVVDYLQLINATKNYDSMVHQISEISRNLKALARELNIPVLALSQLNRAVENRPDQRPRLADLRESGAIEQDADVVLFIYREDKVKPDSDKKNVAEILISKHRNGPTGEVELFFDEDHVSFKNLARHF